MRKIIRQPVPSRSAETSQPGEDRPADGGEPHHGPNAANAPPISDGGKTVLIMPSPCGMSSAPKPPCRTRIAIRKSGDGASAHAADAAVKPAIPIDEHALAAEEVAEAAADDHEHAERERVAGRPPLHRGGAAAELVRGRSAPRS